MRNLPGDSETGFSGTMTKAEFAEDMETVEFQNAKIYHLQPDNQFYTSIFWKTMDKTTNYHDLCTVSPSRM